jgi:Zn-dependent protease with chaperone function
MKAKSGTRRRAVVAMAAMVAMVTTAVALFVTYGNAEAAGAHEAETRDAQLHDESEAAIVAALDARSPEAAQAFREGTAAMGQKDYAAADAAYARAEALLPAASDPTRRRCGLALERGEREHAIALCREALKKEAAPKNATALALALVDDAGGAPSASEKSEAQALIDRAIRDEGHDYFTQLAAARVAIAREDAKALHAASSALDRIAPDALGACVIRFVRAAAEGRNDEAREALLAARAAGLPEGAYTSYVEKLDEQTRWPAMVRFPLGVSVGWALSFVLLAGLGLVLSAATLRASSRVPTEASGHAGVGEARLRRIYRAVLWASCAFYYLSLPLTLLAVLLVGGGFIYLAFAFGHVPIKLVLIACALIVVTAVAIVKSLFVRASDEDPGTRVRLDEHPRLRAVLEEVAAKVGTRVVDSVFMTPGVDLAVMERAGLGKQLRGESERCLIVGAAALHGLDLPAFKAVLAHEYGHFQNEDTAGGGFALAVRRSLVTMALGLARSGAATWYNPAWWFVRGFHKVFLRISHGASRLQEVLADRWAAFSYGAAAFERGLTHIIERSVRFDAHCNATLDEVVGQKRALANLYAYVPDAPLDEASIQTAIEAALTREPSAYDSHPAPRDRIAWVHACERALGVSSKSEDGAGRAAHGAVPSRETTVTGADRDVLAWSLFEAQAALEEQMTDEVRERVRENFGIVVAKREAPTDTATAANVATWP